MVKDKTILKILDKLKTSINFSQVEVVDHWQGDLCAIGIKKRNRLVYISTFNFSNLETTKYDYDLEELNSTDESKFKTIKQGRDVSEDYLTVEIRSFLEV